MVPEKEKWVNSEEKGLLHSDILSGAVPASMAAIDVFEMRPGYKKFQLKNFRNNLASLR